MNQVDRSYDYCRRVARSRAKNFYYSFLLLSRQQAEASRHGVEHFGDANGTTSRTSIFFR